MGKTVVLIEPTQFLGGLTTGGLGATDIGNKRAIGGISREFYARDLRTLRRSRELDAADARGVLRQAAARQRRETEDTMWTFEPHVATQIYDDMLARGEGDRSSSASGSI